MKFIKVSKFLWCVSLESGAQIIGWLLILNCCLTLLGVTLVTILTYTTGFEFSIEFGVEIVDPAVWIVVIFLGILGIYYICLFVASVMLLKAVKHRNHKKTRMMMGMIIVTLIFLFAQAFFNGSDGIIVGIIYFIVQFYCLVIVYSVSEKFKDEFVDRNNRFNGANTINQPHQQAYAYPQQTLGQQGYFVNQQQVPMVSGSWQNQGNPYKPYNNIQPGPSHQFVIQGQAQQSTQGINPV